jgi:flagellar assembly protein FliH
MSEAPASKTAPTPYQRWQMSALGERRSNPPAANPSISKLAQEMMAARDAGHQQGYQAGLLQGRADGQAQGLAQGLAQSELVLREQQTALAHLCQGFEQQAEQAREEIAQQVLALALDMAHALLKSSIELQPERLLPVIEHALQGLPALQSPSNLYLHPQDLELVQTAQGEELTAAGWRLRPDPHLTRGGCRLETPRNEVDATLETRWRRLQQSFGLTAECLSPL